MTANPIAGVIGSPVSGALLNLSGKGLSGWQWMFIFEGLPAILLGGIVFFTLTDRPQEAAWMKNDERTWLLDKLASEQKEQSTLSASSLWKMFFSPRVWGLSIVYFGVSATMYGVTLWLPSVIRAFSSLSYAWTGIVAVLPFLVTTVAMVWVGMLSDHSGERRWHTAIPAFITALALFAAGYANSTVLVIAALTIAMAAAESMVGPFWAMATSQVAGASAAAGIAMINSIANLGGYFGPDIIGMFRTANGGFRGGFLAIGATLAVCGVTALIVGRESQNQSAVGQG
jgi:MFS transporter, ACS family, tartrate transporter